MDEAQVSLDELLAAALQHAPEYATAKELYAALNDKLGISKTFAAWRGIVNRNPDTRRQINERLRRPQVQRQEATQDFDVEKFFELQLAAAADL